MRCQESPLRLVKEWFVIDRPIGVGWAVVFNSFHHFVVPLPQEGGFGLTVHLCHRRRDWIWVAVVFCGRMISSPTREKQDPYGFGTQNFQTMKPVGSEAVRRVSTSEKKQSRFSERMGEQNRNNFTMLSFGSFLSRKKRTRVPSHPSRPKYYST